MSQTLKYILLFIAIIIVTVIVAKVFNYLIEKRLERLKNKGEGDSTQFNFLKHIINALIYIVGFSFAVYSVPTLKALGTSMFAGAGILAVVVGFASQQALGNVVSGIFIILFKPFRLNDRLSIQTFRGIVEDISLRHTVIRDLENKRIIIPNSIIGSEIIVNADFKEDNICKWIDVNISYDSDIDLAKSIIADEVLKHPFHIDPRNPQQIADGDPVVPVRVILLGDSSIHLRAWAWAKDTPSSFIMNCDLLESIKKRFDKENVTIPFPQLRIHKNKNDET